MAESTIYNSQWTGDQMDNAFSVIIESEVTVDELKVLVSASSGVVATGKAVIADTQKNIGTFNRVVANYFKGGYVELTDQSDDISTTPVAGNAYLYIKNASLYTKDSGGSVEKIGGTKEQVFTFSDEATIVCTHNFDNQYPIVTIVGSDNTDLGGQISYTSVNELIVSFNSVETGKIIVRV